MNERISANYASQIRIENVRLNPYLDGRVVVSELQQPHYPQEISLFEHQQRHYKQKASIERTLKQIYKQDQ